MSKGIPPALPVWKRALDLGLMVLSLPLVLPLATLIAVAIKLTSAGPVLFRQERVGYLGRTFVLLKFRTMVVGADTGVHQHHLSTLIASNAPLTKMDAIGDTRLIPIGWVLRATGLDELPQLINVLRGEMSLIGPRPCLPYEFDKLTPHQKRRVGVLPGLTGLWQTSGKNKTTFEEMIHLDITYAYEKSLAMDLGILLRTLPALLEQAGETFARRKTPAAAAPP